MPGTRAGWGDRGWSLHQNQRQQRANNTRAVHIGQNDNNRNNRHATAAAAGRPQARAPGEGATATGAGGWTAVDSRRAAQQKRAQRTLNQQEFALRQRKLRQDELIRAGRARRIAGRVCLVPTRAIKPEERVEVGKSKNLRAQSFHETFVAGTRGHRGRCVKATAHCGYRPSIGKRCRQLRGG